MPQALEFTPGFNLISGQNSSGKTALLEAMGLNFFPHPHRSLQTVPTRGRIPHPDSLVDVSFAVSPEEVKDLMLAMGSSQFSIALPTLNSVFARTAGLRDYSVESCGRLLDFVFSQDLLTFKARLSVAVQQNAHSWTALDVPTFGLYVADRNAQSAFRLMNFQIDRSGKFSVDNAYFGGPSDFGLALASSFQSRVYRFAAERMKVGRGAHGGGVVLAQDASNLPEVLNQLNINPYRLLKLNEKLRAILPQVQQVSVRGTGPGQVEIIVWNHDPKSERDDLAVPLAECGTGIGQVLAILYVVMTSERPQTIIIDEPQSFIHPGAARKLIEFLKDYSQHQYIIVTHSATIISAANPKTITLARLEGSETTPGSTRCCDGERDCSHPNGLRRPAFGHVRR